jgi:16S rRNA (adenine1518-N6/adenine1519-N6)-dimethyltransferase
VQQRIVEAAHLSADDVVLEIGPGPGNLTRRLLAKGVRVIGVEVDRRFMAALDHLSGDHGSRLAVAWGDALELDWETLWGDAAPERRVLIGNIPYQITSPLLAKLAEARRRIARALLMVQREVADRLVAEPGGRTPGALTVKMALDFEIRLLLAVSRRAFRPRPAVDSAVVELIPQSVALVASEEERALVRRLVESAFGSRRQQLINSLARHWRPARTKADWAKRIEAAGLSPSQRAEEIPVEGFVRLAALVGEGEKTLEGDP